MSFDFPPYSSFSYYGLGEFKEFIEEFEHAVQLLQGESHTKHRIALVILDSLAERILVNHARTEFRATEEMWFFSENQATRDEQARILRDFNAKVSFALKTSQRPDRHQPLLGVEDAEVFRVAHRYRNAAYHRGKYNAAVTGPMSRLFAAAIARVFCRSGAWHTHGGMDDAKLADLDRFDWRKPEDPLGSITFPAAAERITEQLVSAVPVDLSTLARSLRADLKNRAEAVQAVLDRVRSRGVPNDALDSLLAAAQYWAANRGDSVLVDLSRQRRDVIKSLDPKGEPSAELRASYQQHELAIESRMEELKAQTKLRFDAGSPMRIARRAPRVSSSNGEGPLLHRYQVLDQELEELEDAADWVDSEVDREIEQAAEIARGK